MWKSEAPAEPERLEDFAFSWFALPISGLALRSAMSHKLAVVRETSMNDLPARLCRSYACGVS